LARGSAVQNEGDNPPRPAVHDGFFDGLEAFPVEMLLRPLKCWRPPWEWPMATAVSPPGGSDERDRFIRVGVNARRGN